MAAYGWNYGGDWGGGYCMVAAADPNDRNCILAAGDTWGLRVTLNGGDEWVGVQGQDLNSGNNQYKAYGRGIVGSLKHSHRFYLGTGTLTSGTRGHVVKVDADLPSGTVTEVMSVGCGGSNSGGGNFDQYHPRPRGRWSVVWDGNPSHPEHLYMWNRTGVLRVDDENWNGATTLISAPASTLNWGWQGIWLLDSTTLLCQTGRNMLAGSRASANSGTNLYLVKNADTSSPTVTDITGLHGAPAFLTDYWSDGTNRFATGSTSGVYSISWDGTTATFTQVWAASSSDDCATIDGVGNTFMVGFCDIATASHGLAVTTNAFGTTPTYVAGSGNASWTVRGTSTDWWNDPNVYSGSNALTKTNFDASMMVCIDSQTFLVVGRAGAYKTVDTGTLWLPSCFGLNGNQTDGIGADTSGKVATNSSDFQHLISTDFGTTATQAGSIPGGYPAIVTGLATRTAGGSTYSLTWAGSYWDVLKDGTSIVDDYAKGAIQNPKHWTVASDGRVYIGQWGGWVIGTPGGTSGGGGGGSTTTPPSQLTPATFTAGDPPQAGTQITTSGGTWAGTPTPSVTRKWQRAPDSGGSPGTWTDISGETGSAYTPGTADVGHWLGLLETATNSAGTTTARLVSSAVCDDFPVAVTTYQIDRGDGAGFVTPSSGTTGLSDTHTYPSGNQTVHVRSVAPDGTPGAASSIDFTV